jgi:hypothetical protein
MGIAWGHSGCLLDTPGARKLSELFIDADKDWNQKVITNFAGFAAGMAKGDIIQHNGTILALLTPGTIAFELTSHGPGHQVGWEEPPGD